MFLGQCGLLSEALAEELAEVGSSTCKRKQKVLADILTKVSGI
jgi:hypothetical protein